jgi:hypothetical protein
MTDADRIEAAAEDPPRRRGQRGPDRAPRRPAGMSTSSIIRAAKKAGFGRLTIDTDGKITVEMGNPELPSGSGGHDAAKGEQNECDAILDRLEKAPRS